MCEHNPALLLTVLNLTHIDSLVNTLNPTLKFDDAGVGSGEGRKGQKKGRMKTRTEERGRNEEEGMEEGREDRKRVAGEEK